MNIQRYIEQVIGDLQEAKKNVPPEPDFGEDYEDFAEEMFKMETAPDVPAKKLFGVSGEELPPPEKLTKEQIEQLLSAMEDNLEAFNCSLDYKEGMPLELKYELVREYFSEDFHYMPGFTMHLDFCSGYCPDCRVAEYCDSADWEWIKEEKGSQET